MPREVIPQAEQHAQSPHVQNVHQMDYPGHQDDVVPGSPQDHAQHVNPSFSPHDSGGGQRQWNEGSGYEPTGHEEHQGELAADDDDSGYNWGPPPSPHDIPDPGFGEHDLDNRGYWQSGNEQGTRPGSVAESWYSQGGHPLTRPDKNEDYGGSFLT